MVVILSSCKREFLNPYDSQTPPELWMPNSFSLDTLEKNKLAINWQQDEMLIDGFVIEKNVNNNLTEFLLPATELRFVDESVVDSSIEDNCSEVTYKVMARAGSNRSKSIGNDFILNFPVASQSSAGPDITINSLSSAVQLNANIPGLNESGTWSILNANDDGTFQNVNLNNTMFYGGCGQFILRWTINGVCNSTNDEILVSFPSDSLQVVANAGEDVFFNGTPYQLMLSANTPPSHANGLWSIVNGSGGNFSNPTIPNPIFTGTAGVNYILRWTITGSCAVSSDELNIYFFK
jgi:hypothetical protein